MGRDLTLGVEEEYQICDPRTGDLTAGIEPLLAAAPPALRGRMSYELLHSVLEGNTPVAADVEEAHALTARLRRELVTLADGLGLALGLSGTHPFASWRDQDFVDTPDYQWVGSQLGYLARRNLSFGLHVHVGVADPEERISVVNRMRRWVAPLLALSCSSPFFEGEPTGFLSIRTHVFGAFPRTGFAPAFRGHADYLATVAALTAAGSITKPRQLWWNLRPRDEFGTVEVRIMDGQPSLRRVRGFVAACQALVAAHLREIREGRREDDLRDAFLSDGLFKAMRFGLEATVVDPATGRTVAMRDAIAELLDTAGAAARELGTARDLAILEEVLERGTEAETQLALLAELGDLRAVQLRLLEQARSEALRGPAASAAVSARTAGP
jgi:carboxylate-amine ligase